MKFNVSTCYFIAVYLYLLPTLLARGTKTRKKNYKLKIFFKRNKEKSTNYINNETNNSGKDTYNARA